jgi:hypothetical protein
LTFAVPAAQVFAGLADPTTHSAIDDTGWVQESVDRTPLTEVGQILRMDMYHPDHPNGDYQVVNKVQVLPATCHRPADGAGRGRRSPGVRRLDLALRPRAAQSVQDRGHALLRLVGGIECHGSHLVATAANSCPAFGQYRPSGRGSFEPFSLHVLKLTSDRITEITYFLNTDRLFLLFGPPPTL